MLYHLYYSLFCLNNFYNFWLVVACKIDQPTNHTIVWIVSVNKKFQKPRAKAKDTFVTFKMYRHTALAGFDCYLVYTSGLRREQDADQFNPTD